MGKTNKLGIPILDPRAPLPFADEADAGAKPAGPRSGKKWDRECWIARALVIAVNPAYAGKFALVDNARDTPVKKTDDMIRDIGQPASGLSVDVSAEKDLGRRRGLGLLGGEVDTEKNETPFWALVRHEGREISWAIIGDPVCLVDSSGKPFVREVVRKDWRAIRENPLKWREIWLKERRNPLFLERTAFYVIFVDVEQWVGLSAEEAQEVEPRTPEETFFSPEEILGMKEAGAGNPASINPENPEAKTENRIYHSHKEAFAECLPLYLQMRARGEI